MIFSQLQIILKINLEFKKMLMYICAIKNKTIMKVQITYTECQWRENTIEVEMTAKEYKEYLKMSKFEQEQKYDLCAMTTDDHFVGLEYSIATEIITK